jgi:hypothetical protein
MTSREPTGIVAVAVKRMESTPAASTRATIRWTPRAPSVQLPTVATPWSFVWRWAFVKAPSPESTEKFTVAPATRLPKASTTRTLGAMGRVDPASPVWLSPERAVSVAGRPGVAVASIVRVTPFPASAVSRFAPAIGPRVQRVLAIPFSSEVAVAGATWPPFVVLKVTLAPRSGCSSLLKTRTSTGWGSASPAGPVRETAETSSIREAGIGAFDVDPPQPPSMVNPSDAERNAVRNCRGRKEWRCVTARKGVGTDYRPQRRPLMRC